MNRGRRWVLASAAMVMGRAVADPLRTTTAEAGQPPAGAVPPVAPTRLTLDAAPLPGAAGRLSYDGTANGPAVRLKPGVPLAVTFTNHLDTPTALQWHGLRGLDAVDQPVEPSQALAAGASVTQTFTPKDTGCFWVHAAALPGLPDHTAAGLRGVIIVEEASPPAADRDVLLTLAQGPAPDPLTVNGAPAPLRETIVTGGRLRLRLLNASTARTLVLAIDGARPRIIAIDGQPSDLFEPLRDAVPAGPGARFELMMDAPGTPGATLRVLTRGTPAGNGVPSPDLLLLELTTEGAARPPLPPIAALPANPALPPAIPLERSSRATLVIEVVAGAGPGRAGWRLNGRASLMLPDRPLLSVARGKPVTLGFDNRGSTPVPLRVHGQAMRLLHTNDDGWEPYWRDSVILAPGSVTHVAFVPDSPGRWLIESAAFDQASTGLRTWFAVT